ncbi:MAG: hypothetical protein QXW97_00050 [Candidatus Pacearchaeota archaeon]
MLTNYKFKKIKENIKEKLFLIKILFFVFLFFFIKLGLFYSLSPSGATSITSNSNQTAPADPPQAVSAVAGNVTEINIFGYSTTQSWQGYYGNVTGVIELTDGNNKTLYNWSVISPKGEVYASNHSSVVWTNIQCFNFTANGTLCAEDSENRGNTSQCGMNLTQLESAYNINYDDVDGVDETFNSQDHQLFYTNNLLFSSGECRNTKIFDNTGNGVFEEVLLWSPDSKAVVFASLLKNNSIGFNGKTQDFEMLVLEDGHKEDVSISIYYFYVELN